MTEYSCTEERFAGDVSQHHMTVIRSDGVNRHLQFRRPGSSTYWFDILTWPGTLCIDGDCGTYVFRRLQDMFDFFRSDGPRINPSYWSEKCVSTSTYREFDWELFAGTVRERVSHWCEEHPDDAAMVQEDIEAALSGAERDEFGAVSLIRDFESGPFQFVDFECNCHEYTFQFIWCLRAIVWAIQQWDAQQAEASAA